MLDRFDFRLLEAVQRDHGRTAHELAGEIPLSPSAISRRLRRLRHQGWIERTISLLGPRLLRSRIRALVLIQLDHHSPVLGFDRLRSLLSTDPAIQWCAEISGAFDLAMLVDHSGMEPFSEWADQLLARNPAVRRYETNVVKRTLRFAPFVTLTDGSSATKS